MDYNCPMCSGSLTLVQGTAMNSKDGWTLFCPSKACPAQEVMGHGYNAKEAYSVITHKFKGPKKY